MSDFILFWYNIYNLELYVYLIIPLAIILFLIYYIYSNFILIKLLLWLNKDILDNIDNDNYHYKG